MRCAWYLGRLGLFQPKEILRFRADSIQTWYSPYWEQSWAIPWEMKKCLFIWSTFGSNTGWPCIFKKFYLFLVVLGLCCCVGFLPSCSKQGDTLCCDILVSNCSGFSCCRTWALAHVGTLVAPWAGGIFPDQRWSPGFSCIGMWILPSWATRESRPCIFIVQSRMLLRMSKGIIEIVLGCQAQLRLSRTKVGCKIILVREPGQRGVYLIVPSGVTFIVFARASAHIWISILIWWFPLDTIKSLIFWRLNYEKDTLGFVKNNINTYICIIIYSLQSIFTHIMSPICTSSLNFKPLNSKPPISEM